MTWIEDIIERSNRDEHNEGDVRSLLAYATYLESKVERLEAENERLRSGYKEPHNGGRWPSNLLLSHHPSCNGECVPGCPILEMDEQSGTLKSGNLNAGHRQGGSAMYHNNNGANRIEKSYGGDSGGASRFFPRFAGEPNFHPDTGAGFKYQAKASRAERGKGLPEGMTNSHPTVKSLSLCDWLVRLVTPPGGTVLDCFLGSGSIGCSAARLGFEFIGIEMDSEYLEIARRRIAYWSQPDAQRIEKPARKQVAPEPTDLIEEGRLF